MSHTALGHSFIAVMVIGLVLVAMPFFLSRTPSKKGIADFPRIKWPSFAADVSKEVVTWSDPDFLRGGKRISVGDWMAETYWVPLTVCRASRVRTGLVSLFTAWGGPIAFTAGDAT
jgi:hypothetical protein